MTKNRTPKPVYLDPGMHPGLEVKGLKTRNKITDFWMILAWASPFNISSVSEKRLNLIPEQIIYKLL